MMYLRTLLASAALLFTACGDNYSLTTPDAEPPPDDGLDEDGCRILSLGRREFHFNLFSQLMGVEIPLTPNLGSKGRDVLRIDLFDSTTPDLPPLAPGAIDLSTMTDLATCQHCVWVDVDTTVDDTVDTIYFATQGTLTIDHVTDPLGPVFGAHTSRVVLRRATVDAEGHSTLVADGDCVSITELSFDTTPTPNQACESAEDCGNALLEICDPSNNTCTPPECNFDSPCTGEGEVCLIQYGDLFDGACYLTCDPSAQVTGCPASQQCAQRGPDPSSGICKYVGTGAVGSTCEVEDNTTSCADGALCSSESHTCANTCDFFAADPGCPGDTQCGLFWLCEPPATGKNVAIGQPCGDDAGRAQGCAPDGEAFRGICFAYEDEPSTCEKACFIDQGCDAGEFCAVRYTSGVGICLPVPVCGDGELGEINEVCDDGNVMNGDGCSSDCQTVDANYLCGQATTLGFATPTQGTTATGIDGFMSTCQFGTARAELYEVTPPGPGRLRLHLTSDTSQTLSLRTTCTDAGSELGCAADFGVPTDQELILQITANNPAPVTVMVSAITVLEQGPYTIEAEFVPEDCGDGVIAGGEVCDDMNTDANDGCSANCRTIEYDALCTLAPALSTSATNAGTLVGAPAIYGASCDVDDGTTLHPARMYTFTAPAAGTLQLKLDDGTSFAVLSVRDGCGAPATATETACRPAFLDGQLTVTLAAGEEITAIVSTYREDGIGTFTLNATFTPQ